VRKPEQADVQPGSRLLRHFRCVTGVLVEEQREGTVAIPAAYLREERAEVPRSAVLATQQHSASGAKVEGAEDRPTSVPSGDRDADLPAEGRPPCAQRREEQHVRLVLGQNDAPFRQSFHFPPQIAFFSLAWGPDPTRDADASRRTSADSARAAACHPIHERSSTSPGARVAEALSSRWPSSPACPGVAPSSTPGTAAPTRSTRWVFPDHLGPTTRPGRPR
jgi:hypothetical protein